MFPNAPVILFQIAAESFEGRQAWQERLVMLTGRMAHIPRPIGDVGAIVRRMEDEIPPIRRDLSEIGVRSDCLRRRHGNLEVRSPHGAATAFGRQSGQIRSPRLEQFR